MKHQDLEVVVTRKEEGGNNSSSNNQPDNSKVQLEVKTMGVGIWMELGTLSWMEIDRWQVRGAMIEWLWKVICRLSASTVVKRAISVLSAVIPQFALSSITQIM